jgi:hypothetical protein
MDNEIREINEKLGELQSMMEDNQRMVRSLYSKAKWATVLSVFKWILIIGVTVGVLVGTGVGVLVGDGLGVLVSVTEGVSVGGGV